jgi:hypothetical protein
MEIAPNKVRLSLSTYKVLGHPLAEDEEGLRIWKVAANLLNKQSETADKGWSSSLGVGRGLQLPAVEKQCVTCYVKKDHDPNFHHIKTRPEVLKAVKVLMLEDGCLLGCSVV